MNLSDIYCILLLQNQVRDISQEELNTVLFWSLVPFALVFIFLFFVIYRGRREAEFRKKTYELEIARAQMEMKALRAQVNPHFIFNCLTSIQDFITKNDNDNAEYYLLRFSRLIRRVLEQSNQRMISLTDDLETLELYVEMEKLRLMDAFSFQVDLEPDINAEEVFIPPLLIQPLIENAIWHGARGSKNDLINLGIRRDGEDIICSVLNEVSVDTSPSGHSDKKRSMGLSLVKERIELFNHLYQRKNVLTIEDVELPETKAPAKKVSIVLPFETDDG